LKTEVEDLATEELQPNRCGTCLKNPSPKVKKLDPIWMPLCWNATYRSFLFSTSIGIYDNYNFRLYTL